MIFRRKGDREKRERERRHAELDAREDELLAEADPDIALVTDYVAGELPPEQMQAVRERLETDEQFRRLVGPIVTAWSLPMRASDRHPMPAHELQEMWAAIRRETGMRPLAEPPAARPAPERRREPRWRMVWGEVRSAAAMVVLVFGLFATFILGGLELTTPEPVIVPLAKDVFGLDTESREAHRTTVPLRLADGTRVVLAPGSRLEWPDDLGSGTSRDVRLEGEATFHVTRRDGVPFRVLTASAVVTVVGTVFTVHQYEGEPAAEVRVREGVVTLRAVQRDSSVSVRAGERARAGRDAPPRVVGAGE